MAASIAALVAGLALLALAVIPRPSFNFSHSAILSGRQSLNAVELAAYLTYLKRNLTIDSVYLLGHIGMWLGFGTLLHRRGNRAGTLIIVLGVISGMLDLFENEMRWAIVGSVPPSASIALGVAWDVTVGMSFWAMLVTTLLTVMLLWSERWADRTIGLIGLGCIPGICLIYFSGYLLTFIWMIIWHGASAIYLWMNAGLTTDHRKGSTD